MGSIIDIKPYHSNNINVVKVKFYCNTITVMRNFFCQILFQDIKFKKNTILFICYSSFFFKDWRTKAFIKRFREIKFKLKTFKNQKYINLYINKYEIIMPIVFVFVLFFGKKKLLNLKKSTNKNLINNFIFNK